MDYQVVIIVLILGTQSQYTESSTVRVFGEEELNNTVEISCYFENKTDPLPVHWYLNGVQMTEYCNILHTANDILNDSLECDNKIGPADYRFFILSLNISRDAYGTWECVHNGQRSVLNMTFDKYAITESHVQATCDKSDNRREALISCSTTIGCAYPQRPVNWCFTVESNRKTWDICSDEVDYWHGIFEDEPDITQTSSSCFDIYGTDDIQSHVSTFTAKSRSKSARKYLTFFVKMNIFQTSVLSGDSRVALDLCLAGCLAIWIISLIVIGSVLVVALAVLGVYFYMKKNGQESPRVDNINDPCTREGAEPANYPGEKGKDPRVDNLNYPSKWEDKKQDNYPGEQNQDYQSTIPHGKEKRQGHQAIRNDPNFKMVPVKLPPDGKDRPLPKSEGSDSRPDDYQSHM